jgi:hypothetical protein
MFDPQNFIITTPIMGGGAFLAQKSRATEKQKRSGKTAATLNVVAGLSWQERDESKQRTSDTGCRTVLS